MIVGAGLAGLIAAHAFPTHELIDAMPEPKQTHKALLRFRSQRVGDLVGVEFKPVEVFKAIWLDGTEVPPSIRMSNLYSEKVVGKLLPRSIKQAESVLRYVAPPDLYETLLTSVGSRITWGEKADFNTIGACISTAPLPLVLADLNYTVRSVFRRSEIAVKRFLIDDADVYQTTYYPTREHTLYRASITGDLLICEFAGEPSGAWWYDVIASFALERTQIDEIETTSQQYGKIIPIDEDERRALVAKLTIEHDIFSLGRFATWRNLLLDDVVDDIAVVRRLMKASHYERRLASVATAF